MQLNLSIVYNIIKVTNNSGRLEQRSNIHFIHSLSIIEEIELNLLIAKSLILYIYRMHMDFHDLQAPRRWFSIKPIYSTNHLYSIFYFKKKIISFSLNYYYSFFLFFFLSLGQLPKLHSLISSSIFRTQSWQVSLSLLHEREHKISLTLSKIGSIYIYMCMYVCV